MSFNPELPPELFRADPYALRWYNELVKRIDRDGQIVWSQLDLTNATEIINSEAHIAATVAHGANGDIVGNQDFATTSVGGVVKKAIAVSDAGTSSVEVTSSAFNSLIKSLSPVL